MIGQVKRQLYFSVCPGVMKKQNLEKLEAGPKHVFQSDTAQA